jgi:hypothetical protein
MDVRDSRPTAVMLQLPQFDMQHDVIGHLVPPSQPTQQINGLGQTGVKASLAPSATTTSKHTDPSRARIHIGSETYSLQPPSHHTSSCATKDMRSPAIVHQTDNRASHNFQGPRSNLIKMRK